MGGNVQQARDLDGRRNGAGRLRDVGGERSFVASASADVVGLDEDLFDPLWPMPVDEFLRGNHLARADIVLTRRAGDFTSWMIRWATQSHFSHAAMVFLVPLPREGFEHTFVIEARREGVDVTNIEEFLKDPRTVVAIKRFEAPWFHEEIQKTVSGRLLNSIKWSYSYSRIWGLIRQLVGQAWFGVRRRMIGQLELLERYRDAGRTPPNEYICSGLVQDGFVDGVLDFIRRGVLRPEAFPEIVFDPELASMMGDEWSAFSEDEKRQIVEAFAEQFHDDLLSIRPVDLSRSDRLTWRFVAFGGMVYRVRSYEAADKLLQMHEVDCPSRSGHS